MTDTTENELRDLLTRRVEGVSAHNITHESVRAHADARHRTISVPWASAAAAAAVVAIVAGGGALVGTRSNSPTDNPQLQPAASVTITATPSTTNTGFGLVPHCPAQYRDPNTGYDVCATGTPPSLRPGQVTSHYYHGD